MPWQRRVQFRPTRHQAAHYSGPGKWNEADKLLKRNRSLPNVALGALAVRRAPGTQRRMLGDHALIVLNTVENVALVITDMRMPGQTDGAALLSWLRQEKPHIKVIVVSGNMASDKLPTNADARFSKPLDMEALVHRARHLLDGTSD